MKKVFLLITLIVCFTLAYRMDHSGIQYYVEIAKYIPYVAIGACCLEILME